MGQTKIVPDGSYSADEPAPPSHGGGLVAQDLAHVQPSPPADPLGGMTERAAYSNGWTRRDLRRSLALAIAAVVALVFLVQVDAILPPFVISFALAALLDPTIRYFQRHGHSRARAIFTVYLTGFTFVFAFAWFVIPAVTNQVEDISGNFSVYSADVQNAADGWMATHRDMLQKAGIRQRRLRDFVEQQFGPIQARVAAALGGLSLFLGGAATKILWLIIIPIATFFLMRDYPLLRARIIAFFPDDYHDQIDTMSREIVDVFGAYIRGLARICALYSVVAILLFTLLGLKYALFLGLAAGLFYAVPYVGQIITAAACAIVAYTMPAHAVFFVFHIDAHSQGYALMVVILAIVAQNVFDQILYPRIVGGSVGLHPVVSIFALMAGATLFGVWGMLMAVPVAASIQILLVFFFPSLKQAPPSRLLHTGM
jgi:predicted PurR-regulated permease PerM